MSFKKALTKMGLIEEEVQTQAPTKPVPQPTAPTQSFTSPTSTFTPQYQPTPVSNDPAIESMLSQSLQENKLAGFDYLKFVSAVEEMKSLGTPEDARFKMAFFTAKQLGVDKNGLLTSGSHYLTVLKQDEDEFNVNCAEHYKNNIQAKTNKIAQMEETMANLAKQLAQIQQDHALLKQEVLVESEKLEQKKNSFQLTLKNFRANIESNIQKINQYL